MRSTLAMVLIGILFCLSLGGCGLLTRIDTRTQQQITQIKNNAKIKNAQGKANPLLHPFSAGNNTAQEFHAPLVWVCSASFLLLAVSIGLQFTAFSAISRIGIPVAGAVMVGSFVLLILLPFLFWVILAGGIAIVGFVIYELVIYKGNVGEVVKAIEADIGIAPAVPAVSAVEPSTPVASNLAASPPPASAAAPATPAGTMATLVADAENLVKKI